MKGTLQKVCKGHPLGGTTFLVHAVNQRWHGPCVLLAMTATYVGMFSWLL
jgi:hypothetical protein